MFKDLLAKWKSAWLLQAAFVAFLVPIVGQLVASPPTLWREAGQQPAFATFLITVVVAFLACSVMAGRQPALRSTIIWLVPVAVVFMVVYFPLRAYFSCPFADDRMSTGWTYLPTAAEYVEKNPGQGCDLLIADFIGDTDKLWPRSQILVTWALVLLVYVAAVTFVAMTLVRVMDHIRGE